MKKTVMIAESFDSRTLANMEVAVERACKGLSIGAEEHRARRQIAKKILKCAERGDITLGGLTAAARAAATELAATHVSLAEEHAMKIKAAPSSRRP